MKKTNIIMITVTAALVAAVAVFALWNAGNMAEKKVLAEEAIVLVRSNDQVLGKIDMALIQRIGLKDFYANLDTSESDAQEHVYTGVWLNDAFKSLGIAIDDYHTVIARAVDGYTVAFEASEVAEADHIYIAVMRDGKLLGTRSQGGDGPYQIIVRKDAFGQRWCKFLVELELK